MAKVAFGQFRRSDCWPNVHGGWTLRWRNGRMIGPTHSISRYACFCSRSLHLASGTGFGWNERTNRYFVHYGCSACWNCSFGPRSWIDSSRYRHDGTFPHSGIVRPPTAVLLPSHRARSNEAFEFASLIPLSPLSHLQQTRQLSFLFANEKLFQHLKLFLNPPFSSTSTSLVGRNLSRRRLNCLRF